MSAAFIGGFVLAAFPALFLGVNNGATVLGVLVMAYSGYRIIKAVKA